MYISQPGLSKFLMNLEDELGLKLLERTGKKYVPTEAGKLYLKYANATLEIKARMDAELSETKENDIDVLNIGIADSQCDFLLPNTIQVFNTKYPNVKLNVIDGSNT